MAYQVIWSPKADAMMYEATAYLAENWPDSVLEDFVDKVFKATELLSSFPEIGQKTKRGKTIRSYLIKPYTRLVYRIKTDKVVILGLIDTRQKPQ